ISTARYVNHRAAKQKYLGIRYPGKYFVTHQIHQRFYLRWVCRVNKTAAGVRAIRVKVITFNPRCFATAVIRFQPLNHTISQFLLEEFNIAARRQAEVKKEAINRRTWHKVGAWQQHDRY